MRKIIAFVVCLLLLVAFSSVAFAAYSGSNYTTNGDLADKLTKLLNGEVSIFKSGAKYKVDDTFPDNVKFYWDSDNGYQCYAYANAAYYYLFGDSPGHGNGSYSKSKIVSGVKGKSSLSYDIFVSKGIGCGAWIRTTYNSSGAYDSANAHSIIVLSYNSSNVTFLHAARKTSGGSYYIQLSTKSWSDFNKYLFTNPNPDRYVCAILQPNLTANTINEPIYDSYEFKDVVYPKTFKINTSGGWDLSGGTLVCDRQLKTITTTIMTADEKTTVSGPKTHNIGGYSYQIINLDTRDGTNNGVRFSYIKNAGDYVWILKATDVDGRELEMKMPFSTGSSTSTDKMSKTYGSTPSGSTLTIPSTKTITMGQRNLISATGNYTNLVWETSNSSVAMISSDGYVFGNKPGTATITVTADGTTTKTCVVTVNQPTTDSTTFNHGSQIAGSINSDNKRAWIFDVTPSSSGYYVFESRFYDSDTIGFVYDSSWNLIESDDDSGEGFRFQIQVYLNAGTKYYLVGRFYDVSTSGDFALGFYKDEQQVAIPSGVTVELGNRVSISQSIASTTDFSWSTSDTSVAKVDSNGYVYGVGLGSCTITVTSTSNSNNSAQCTVTVTTPTVIDTVWGTGNTYYSIQNDSDRRAIIGKYTPDKTCEYLFWSTGDTDTYCIIYDELWNVYCLDDDSGDGNNFSISTVLYANQAYYIFVRPYSPQYSATLRYYLARETADLAADTYAGVNIYEANLVKHYKFIPSETATYAFYSDGSLDTVGKIYDSGWSLLASNDDGAEGYNFFVKYDLVAGQTYYIEAGLWSTNTGYFSIIAEKYRPVSYIACGNRNVLLGTTDVFYAYPCAADGSLASNRGFYFDAVEDDICSVSWDGSVVGKNKGLSSTTVYSKDNPDASQSVPIYVHDPLSFSCNASTDSNGRVILTFSSNAASDNRFSAYELIFEDLDSWFDIVNCEVTNKQTSFINYTWSGGQGIKICEQNGTNSISASQPARYCLLPQNIESLWGTTKQYKFNLYIDISYNDNLYSMVCSDTFTVNVSFPQKPACFTSPDLILPTALKVIEDEAFYGISAKQIKLPDGTTSIGNKAFAQCANLCIYIPESCTSIAANAFDGDTGLVIYGKRGSYAQTYANQYGLTFAPVK